MPPNPDEALGVLLETGGSIPNDVSEEHLVTIRSRAASFDVASERLKDVLVYLVRTRDGQGLYGGVLVGRLRAASTPVSLGQDQQRRWQVQQVFTALLKSATAFV